LERLHNEELYGLYASANIILLLKSIQTIGVTYGTFEEEERHIQGFFVGRNDGKRPLGRARQTDRIIVKEALKK
jgi:hypothetical protein